MAAARASGSDKELEPGPSGYSSAMSVSVEWGLPTNVPCNLHYIGSQETAMMLHDGSRWSLPGGRPASGQLLVHPARGPLGACRPGATPTRRHGCPASRGRRSGGMQGL